MKSGGGAETGGARRRGEEKEPGGAGWQTEVPSYNLSGAFIEIVPRSFGKRLKPAERNTINKTSRGHN